jgi:hypothetical protein
VRSERPLGRFLDIFQPSMDRISRADRHHAQFRIAEDRPQHIVEVVGHPAGQPADRLHFLGLFKLLADPVVLLFHFLDQGNVGCNLQPYHSSIQPLNGPVVVDVPFSGERVLCLPDTDTRGATIRIQQAFIGAIFARAVWPRKAS